MNGFLRNTLALAAIACSTQVAAQVTFYEGEGFQGRSFSTEVQVDNFARTGFNDRAGSVEVLRDRWEVCSDSGFQGRCVILRPGRYPSLVAMGMNDNISSVRMVSREARVEDRRYAPAPAQAQITLYERENFQGRTFTTDKQIGSFDRNGFNDRASSAEVVGDVWEVCQNNWFGGRCAILRPGRYPSFAAMGLNDAVSSVRTVGANTNLNDNRYARPAPPPPAPVTRDYRRRDNERLYDARVTSVHAVLGTPEQHCWVEKEQVPQERSSANVPGAIAGALIGGILGHQVGNGSGKDLATVGGAVAGGALGANVGRDGGTTTRDVQHCSAAQANTRPDYWDVTYNFRGVDHRVQMTTAPGNTVTVNEQGEPRN